MSGFLPLHSLAPDEGDLLLRLGTGLRRITTGDVDGGLGGLFLEPRLAPQGLELAVLGPQLLLALRGHCLLGLLDEGGELSDAGLVDFVQAEAARRGEEYAPPLEFYARLEEAMREEYP